MKRTILISLLITSATLSAKAITWEEMQQHLKISGYMQMLYTCECADERSEGPSFRIRRARLSFAGKIVDKKESGVADYRLQVEFAESPKIIDAWVRYRPLSQLGLQVGQFKVPLSIENSEYAPLKLEFIDYSLVVQRLVKMSSNDVTGISSTGRDCGAQLYGGFIKRKGFCLLNYNLAIFNGNGINAKKDNNSSKDLVGRLMICPLRELVVAGYYQYGKCIMGELKDVVCQRYGGGAAYNGRHAFARAEYIRGNTGTLLSEGAYASAGWKFSSTKAGSGSVGARFDYFDKDIRTSSREFNYTLGVAYQPWRYMRLQIDYTLKQYQHPNHSLAHSLAVMVSGIF